MFADIHGIHRGGRRTQESAEYVDAAAQKLGASAVDLTMFGRVSAADGAAARLSAVHSGHVDGLKAHHTALFGIRDHVTNTANTIHESDDNIASTIEHSGPA